MDMKNFVKTIKAIFNIAGKGFVLDLKSAEIRRDKAYLHPVDNDNITYVVKAETVDILLNNGEDIKEEDFYVIDKTNSNSNPDVENDAPTEPVIEIETKRNRNYQPITRTPSPYNKTTIRFTVYADEGEMINNLIKNSGIKRSDYLMACLMNSQKKSNIKSFAAECERIKRKRVQREMEVRKQSKTG